MKYIILGAALITLSNCGIVRRVISLPITVLAQNQMSDAEEQSTALLHPTPQPLSALNNE